jgi:membrane-associated protease RseP (regulator of RpoE activity)
VTGSAALVSGVNPGLAQPVSIFSDTPASLAHNSGGYLGVELHDIDNDRATALKLKDAHGAEIVTVDHDAPANKAGLKPHDVVLEMNGQRVEGADQLRRMLRETPAGHTVHFVVSRDGAEKEISVELADRSKVEAEAWSKHFSVPDPEEAPLPDGFLPPSSSHGFGNGFFGVFTGNSLYVGADVDAISTQLASYFGVTDGSGLLVRSVDENSPAATAGLKAGDVITKVNNERMASRSDWFKALHSNRGKQVQLTVMRDKKEQKLTMQAGEPKKKGEMDWPCVWPDQQQLKAELNRDFAALIPNEIQNAQAAAMAAQADAMAKSIDATKLSEEIQNEINSKEFRKMQQELQQMEERLEHQMN